MLISWKLWNGTLCVSTAFYENGKITTEDSDYAWNDEYDWADYDEEKDAYIIPEGWFESVRFAEEFGVVDRVVTHWMPLPEPPKMIDEEPCEACSLDELWEQIKINGKKDAE